jgi:hypothetical protein
MPRNGEINKEFGFYENLCCGAEIVIPAGVTFQTPREFYGMAGRRTQETPSRPRIGEKGQSRMKVHAMQPATIREFVAHDAFPRSAPQPRHTSCDVIVLGSHFIKLRCNPHTSGIRFNGLSYEQRKTV